MEFVNSQAKQMRFSQDMWTLRQILKIKVTAEADLQQQTGPVLVVNLID